MTRTGTAPAAPKVRRPARRTVPSRRLENELLAALPDGGLVAGMDEVGRGALAGPVSVGVAVVGATTSRRMPKGLADSKLLSAQAREDLVAPVRRWCAGWAVAHASPAEIDEIGIIAALRLAGRRALAELAGAGLVPGIVILDGVHDWLSEPAQTELFAPQLPDVLVPGTGEEVATPPVRTQVKADASCAVVAAASVLAKVTRDSLMVGLDPEHPQFGWAGNKGYSSAEHVAALAEHGACELHRRSWRLPGLGGAAGIDGAGGLEVSGLDDAGYDGAEYDDYDGSGYDGGSEGVTYDVAGSDGGDGLAPDRAAAVGAGATVAAGRA
ncbi:ribonuclease HII [Georgenia subflava]|uniref:Ribonuclease HII n=1 Tax=Georgenia subflava TaxID=1622177 RepID=A0A6N7EJE3_9MICO|nr:ribonuclease HII [Georgenia subflava]MPV38210.1 ribonuclease HII [Georgenia subflava]